MSFITKRRRDMQAAIERVSLAEQFPGIEWDQETTELAAVGALLEPSYVPSERARAARKAAMLEAFDEQYGRKRNAADGGRRPVVIADVEQVSDEEAEVVATRFAALIAEQAYHR